jgi:hypothetical protein
MPEESGRKEIPNLCMSPSVSMSGRSNKEVSLVKPNFKRNRAPSIKPTKRTKKTGTGIGGLNRRTRVIAIRRKKQVKETGVIEPTQSTDGGIASGSAQRSSANTKSSTCTG